MIETKLQFKLKENGNFILENLTDNTKMEIDYNEKNYQQMRYIIHLHMKKEKNIFLKMIFGTLKIKLWYNILKSLNQLFQTFAKILI